MVRHLGEQVAPDTEVAENMLSRLLLGGGGGGGILWEAISIIIFTLPPSCRAASLPPLLHISLIFTPSHSHLDLKDDFLKHLDSKESGKPICIHLYRVLVFP